MSFALSRVRYDIQAKEGENKHRQGVQNGTAITDLHIGHTDDTDHQNKKCQDRVEEDKHGPYRRCWSIQASYVGAFLGLFVGDGEVGRPVMADRIYWLQGGVGRLYLAGTDGVCFGQVVFYLSRNLST